MNNIKDYGFIIAMILLIVLNLTSLYYVKNGNNTLNEKIVKLSKEYTKQVNDDLVKSKKEYDEKINNILSTYNEIESRKKNIKPIGVTKKSDSNLSTEKKEQPKGDKELSNALNFNGYTNNIMYCYTSPK